MHPIPSQTFAPGRSSSAAVAPDAAAIEVAAVAVAVAADVAVAAAAVVATAAHRSAPREWAEWGRHPARPSNRRPIPGPVALCSSAGQSFAAADPRISRDSVWNSGSAGLWRCVAWS
ncbi:uncharacterized protein LOC108046436 [Drosophila rhopaloa]|uniref:Uncharacterized protein n=1 Tax=Drosophila rhopaloa TaxID=1041015 RepID=A0ABM5JEG7_DRORH|nr:uncharacterized protein LOC108046436 [Drosophila rhopaloa]